MAEEKWWEKGRTERIKQREFMIGWELCLVYQPKYGLTEEEYSKVQDCVVEYLCGLTPYKSWRDAAESMCKALVKARKQEGNE